MVYRRRRTIEKVSPAINVERPQVKPKAVFVESQLEQWLNSRFAKKSLAHLIRCACTPDDMRYVEALIRLRYEAAQGIIPIDGFVKPIKSLTSTRRDAGCV